MIIRALNKQAVLNYKFEIQSTKFETMTKIIITQTVRFQRIE